MAEFTPITTQEEFDKAIGARLKRERDTVAKEYEGRLSESETKLKDYEGKVGTLSGQLEEAGKKNKEYESKIAERDGKIKGYESSAMKARIAHETGLPYEMAERLTGDDEEAIKKDAESLKKIIGSRKPAQRKSTEDPVIDDKRAAMQRVLRKLNGKGE